MTSGSDTDSPSDDTGASGATAGAGSSRAGSSCRTGAGNSSSGCTTGSTVTSSEEDAVVVDEGITIVVCGTSRSGGLPSRRAVPTV